MPTEQSNRDRRNRYRSGRNPRNEARRANPTSSVKRADQRIEPQAPKVEHVEEEAPTADSDVNVFSLLDPALQRAVKETGYETPTPIQQKAIQPLLKGRDLMACSQTGTGKTAAFVLPMLHQLARSKATRASGEPRALILAPTRELARQIDDSIEKYGRYMSVSHTVIFGGVGQGPQVSALRRGVDIVVATPGRLLDLMNQRAIRLSRVEFFVLDEADRMLDMGFLPDIRKIIRPLPESRQSLLFSATFPGEIVKLVESLANNPMRISIAPKQPAVERIRQSVMFMERGEKDRALASLLADESIERVIVFTKMKHAANRIVRKLDKRGISADAIHGNKSQSARERSLRGFSQGKTRVLVATDIAARGLDIKQVSHVINYDLPNVPENYVHRIGRTARAGAEGEAVSFCSGDERAQLRGIEKLLKKPIPVARR